MGRMEIITRTERRRSYNDDERAAAVAASFEPGVTVREVARRLGIAESLIYNWRSAHRKATSLAAPMQFIFYSDTKPDVGNAACSIGSTSAACGTRCRREDPAGGG